MSHFPEVFHIPIRVDLHEADQSPGAPHQETMPDKEAVHFDISALESDTVVLVDLALDHSAVAFMVSNLCTFRVGPAYNPLRLCVELYQVFVCAAVKWSFRCEDDIA